MNQRWLMGLGAIALATPGLAQDSVPLETDAPTPVLPAYSLTVNSPLDGPVTPDDALTLREALELANGP